MYITDADLKLYIRSDKERLGQALLDIAAGVASKLGIFGAERDDFIQDAVLQCLESLGTANGSSTATAGSRMQIESPFNYFTSICFYKHKTIVGKNSHKQALFQEFASGTTTLTPCVTCSKPRNKGCKYCPGCLAQRRGKQQTIGSCARCGTQIIIKRWNHKYCQLCSKLNNRERYKEQKTILC